VALRPFQKLNAKGEELFSRGQDNVAESLRALGTKKLLISGESVLYLEAEVTVPTDWQGVTFGTDWTQWGTDTVLYRKSADGSRVELWGMADSNGAGVATTIFTLGAAYWPAGPEVRITNANSTIARVDVTTAGVVTYVTGDRTQWFNLAGIWFEPADRTPLAASCWPIQIPCNLKTRPDAVVLASAVEQASGDAVCAANPDWDWETQAGQNFLIINNVPFLPPATYDLTFAVLGVT
jgi:hypothetical protein